MSEAIGAYQRRKMLAALLGSIELEHRDSILDVGVTSDQLYYESNYLEALYPNRSRITAIGVDDASFLEKLYPGVRFIRGDGRHLPFTDYSFDIVHSSAVLEHVGSKNQQIEFLGELWRVTRKGVFVTTPNRWFPVEFHTVLPLLHWFPRRVHRRILAAFGREFFAKEENLRLLSRKDLAAAAHHAGMQTFCIRSVRLFGWATNLVLVARKLSSIHQE
jgi:hypothetical protein